jgi:hypothetical protein
VDGSIWVVSATPPNINRASLSGNNLILSGTGGTPNWYYYALSSTNLAVPVAQWPRIATNQFDNTGNFNFTNSINPMSPGFMILQVP